MQTAHTGTLRKHRKTVVSFLGLNLWLALVGLPTLAKAPEIISPVLVACGCILSLALLTIGVLRTSPRLLLLVFPSSVGLTLLLDPTLSQAELYPLDAVAVRGIVFLLYIGSALWLTEQPSLENTWRKVPFSTAINLTPTARRIPLWLAFLSALFGIVLLGLLNAPDDIRGLLGAPHGPHADLLSALTTIIGLALWAGLFGVSFVRTLSEALHGTPPQTKQLGGSLLRPFSWIRFALAMLLAALAAFMAGFLIIRGYRQGS